MGFYAYDRDAVKAAGRPDAIAVIVTNSGEFLEVERKANGDIHSGDFLILK